MQWGDFLIHRVSDGGLWLDGGAMFGVVPKPLWSKQTTPDERNRIPLGLNCLLIRTPRKNVLIDTGCGHKYSPKEIDIYRIEHPTDVVQQLAGLGLQPEDVDLVINTHLHFDHCGGNTRIDGGRAVPTFPNATYVVRHQELADASRPNERTRATYFEHNWKPLEERGQLQVIGEDCEILPGIRLINTPGHTLGHQSVLIESRGQTLLYIADLCPTTAHLPLPWIMGYDLYPMTTLETRKRIYAQAAQQGWLLFFEHDPRNFAGYLRQEGGNYILQPHHWED